MHNAEKARLPGMTLTGEEDKVNYLVTQFTKLSLTETNL
jgi:hypothetical protein